MDQAAGGFGIGASAGGLAAFEAFSSLSGAEADSGSPMIARFGILRPLRDATWTLVGLTCAALDITRQQHPPAGNKREEKP